MKQSFLIYTASFIISIFIILLPGSVFCEPMVLDDAELSEINAQAGPIIPKPEGNEGREVITASAQTAETDLSDINGGSSLPKNSIDSDPLNDMREMSNMNQFNNMGAGGGGGASCH